MMTPQRVSELKLTAMVDALRSCRLFAGLPAEDLRNVAAITVVRQLAKGDYLFHEGEPSRGFYIVQQGSVNVHRVNPSGKEQVIHVFRPGESFAEGAVATDVGYPADARALESSQVLQVQKTEFIALLRRHPELALRMLGTMSQHLRVLVGLLDDLRLKDVETRLARWLVKRCPDPVSATPCRIDLTMPKRVLAAELGTVSETFSRTLGKFRDLGLIAVKGKTVTVLSPAGLTDLLRKHLGE